MSAYWNDYFRCGDRYGYGEVYGYGDGYGTYADGFRPGRYSPYFPYGYYDPYLNGTYADITPYLTPGLCGSYRVSQVPPCYYSPHSINPSCM